MGNYFKRMLMRHVIAFLTVVCMSVIAVAKPIDCKVVEIGGDQYLICGLNEGPSIPGNPDFSIPGFPSKPSPEKPSYGPTVPGSPDFGINPPVDKPEKPSYGPTVPGEPSNEAPARPIKPQNPCVAFPVYWIK